MRGLGVLITALIAAIVLVSDRYRMPRTHDFQDLSRYRPLNALVRVPPDIVFIGDSIVEFWDLGTSFPGKQYVNRGIMTQTTSQVLLRMHQDVISLRPSTVIVEVGTNDLGGLDGPMSLDQIEANFEGIREIAAAHKIHVIFASLLPVNEYTLNAKREQWISNRPPAKIMQLNAWLQYYCASTGAVYLDFFSRMVDKQGLLQRELSDDGLHPNRAGYSLMAAYASSVLADRDTLHPLASEAK